MGYWKRLERRKAGALNLLEVIVTFASPIEQTNLHLIIAKVNSEL